MSDLKRRIEWYLTTDFDMHDPMPRAHVQGILIILALIALALILS